MKNTLLAVTFVAVTAFSVGCEPATKTSATETEKPIAQQLDKVKKDTNEAARDMQDYAYAQKAEFIAEMQRQLDEINGDLDRLTEKVETAGDAAKAEAQPKLQTLRDQVALLTQQVDKAKDASESTWGDVKSGFKEGYSEVKDGVQQAREWVSEKIAP